MKFVFFSLCLFLIACSADARNSSQFQLSLETLPSPTAQWQKQMALQAADFPVKLLVNSDPSRSFRLNPAEIKKIEGIRKTIAAIGVSILIPVAILVSLFGGGAFSKTLSPEERKKRIKWIVIGVILMVLASYWNDLVSIAVTVFMGLG